MQENGKGQCVMEQHYDPDGKTEWCTRAEAIDERYMYDAIYTENMHDAIYWRYAWCYLLKICIVLFTEDIHNAIYWGNAQCYLLKIYMILIKEDMHGAIFNDMQGAIYWRYAWSIYTKDMLGVSTEDMYDACHLYWRYMHGAIYNAAWRGSIYRRYTWC